MKDPCKNTTALLLIAHGSRQPDANADLFHIAQQLKQNGSFSIVQPSFLELAEPTVSQGADLCVGAGATRIVMLPYFLSAGVHVERDLAELQQSLSAKHEQIDFRLAKPLGRHSLLVDIVLERALDCL